MNTKSILISLKPCYAELVFQGIKKYELRKRGIPCQTDCEVYVYVSSPVRRLRGGFRVGDISSGHPDEIWSKVSKYACVKRRDYEAYYRGHTVAHAIKIANLWEHINPLDLDTLRRKLSGFIAPQTWRYVTEKEHQLFQNMRRRNLRNFEN